MFCNTTVSPGNSANVKGITSPRKSLGAREYNITMSECDKIP